MSVAQITRNFVDSIENGKIFMYDDIPDDNKMGIAIELSRLFKKGLIKKVSKGKYYKPKITPFGEIGPSSDEKIKSFIEASSNDYVSGISNLNRLGLTTQVPNVITIASNQSSRKVKLQNTTIKFVPKLNQSSKKDIKLSQLLDALNSLKKIPDTSIDEAFRMIKIMIEKLEKKEQQGLAKLALNYPPRTKALVGAILKNVGLWEEAYKLKSTLNPISIYKINISKEILPNKDEWRIV
jgi:hypothetical protein